MPRISSTKDLTARETKDIREDYLETQQGPTDRCMNVGHPRDADPSIRGQPHQVTDKVSDLMGKISCTHGHATDMPAAVPEQYRYRRNPFSGQLR